MLEQKTKVARYAFAADTYKDVSFIQIDLFSSFIKLNSLLFVGSLFN